MVPALWQPELVSPSPKTGPQITLLWFSDARKFWEVKARPVLRTLMKSFVRISGRFEFLGPDTEIVSHFDNSLKSGKNGSDMHAFSA